MRRNVCIVTSYNKNYKEVAELTMPNIIKYCNKHSIDFYKSEKQ